MGEGVRCFDLVFGLRWSFGRQSRLALGNGLQDDDDMIDPASLTDTCGRLPVQYERTLLTISHDLVYTLRTCLLP